MVLVNVSVLPHGAMLLDMDLQDLPAGVPEVHGACVSAASNLDASNPDIIILYTPHGICTKTKPAVYLNQSVAGNAGWNGFWESFHVCAPCNCETAEGLLSHLNSTADTKSTGITCFSKVCAAALAWGEVVPLHFCKPLLDSGAEVVICSWPQLRFRPVQYTDSAIAMGKALYEFATRHPKRVALMFSCDLSHVHGEPPESAPIFRGDPTLGVDKVLAERFDSSVVRWVECIASGDVQGGREVLMGEDCLGLVERAKCCGWAGFCAVQGCLESAAGANNSYGDDNGSSAKDNSEGKREKTFQTAQSSPRTARLLQEQWAGKLWGYGAPTYFGMLAATFSFEHGAVEETNQDSKS